MNGEGRSLNESLAATTILASAKLVVTREKLANFASSMADEVVTHNGRSLE
jgi:hypothetical protein